MPESPPPATERRAADGDLFQWYRAMRTAAPVHYRPDENLYEVFGYDAVKTVLANYRDFSSDFRRYREQRGEAPGPAGLLFGESLIGLDPPRHTGFRQLVNPPFHGQALAALAPRLEQLASTYLDAMATQAAPVVDFVSALAYPFPVAVISELLGVPADHLDQFKAWVDAILGPVGSADPHILPNPRLWADPQRQAAGQALRTYFERIVEERREHPANDLITLLLTAQVDGRPLNLEEILSFCVLLLIAGHVTTTNLLANAVWQLAHTPDLIPALRAGGREQQRWFLEEVLRFWSPVQRLSRFSTGPVTLGGVAIPPDTAVVAWIGAANRDPERFADPEQFQPRRQPNPHLSFGFGIHACLGAPLARLEAQIALHLLLQRYQRWLPADERLRPFPRGILLGLERLPLMLTPT